MPASSAELEVKEDGTSLGERRWVQLGTEWPKWRYTARSWVLRVCSPGDRDRLATVVRVGGILAVFETTGGKEITAVGVGAQAEGEGQGTLGKVCIKTSL